MSAAPPGVEGAMMRMARRPVGGAGRAGANGAEHGDNDRNDRAFHMALMTHDSDTMMRALHAPRKHRCANNGIDRWRGTKRARQIASGENDHVARACIFAVAGNCVVGMLVLAATHARSQDYPSRAIKIIVPLAPGGLADTLARIVSQRLAEASGQAVVVENRPGGAGAVGAEAAAQRRPTATRCSWGASRPTR